MNKEQITDASTKISALSRLTCYKEALKLEIEITSDPYGLWMDEDFETDIYCQIKKHLRAKADVRIAKLEAELKEMGVEL